MGIKHLFAFAKHTKPDSVASSPASHHDRPEPLTTRQKGADVERLTEKFLQQQGLKSVTRNYNIRGGELDLIMRDGKVLVFVEVRYRRNNTHGSGAESITLHKQARLIKAAEHYLQKEYGSRLPDCRFDVVSASGEPVVFEWLKNVFG